MSDTHPSHEDPQALLEETYRERLARESAIRGHRLYPDLWRKVAAEEAAGLHPIRRRYRHCPTYGWTHTLAASSPDGSSTWPGKRSAYPRCASLMKAAYQIAERMLPDLVATGLWPPETLTESWRRSDLLSHCYVLARADVTARRAPSRR
jgi:hypothetical protein